MCQTQSDCDSDSDINYQESRIDIFLSKMLGILVTFIICQSILSSSIPQLKVELLKLAKQVNRGFTDTPESSEKIRNLFVNLEQANENKDTLSNPNISGNFIFHFHASVSIFLMGIYCYKYR